ncbi:MAG: 1-(5-phosphoribosyl)-5-[(5-phosphoribosylamino)methylideneamino]imidazole-4-carboxamide isomerase [Candidatus Hodarchaeaceae archaeon]|nr:1-(5-phosphoribosyl)-5-[(5-phosphoribosylamino)methylideneamino]imidazole-4-carboxamide isomerase [Candidatus Hodarchaeaceae archaeon]
MMMLVIPSVDIRRGRCVQLVGGRPETERVYGDPVEAAQRWIAEGARYLHLIDLDAAMGTGDNFNKIAEVLASVNVGVQVGGGIRSAERASELLGIGADRVILSTAMIREPELARELVELAGGARIMAAIDTRAGRAVIEGWATPTQRPAVELAREFERMGVGSLLFTNVDVEGRMAGVAAGAIRELVRAVKIPVFAAGGVASVEDVRTAREAGAAGLVIGMALYEGRLTLRQAMEVAE